MMLTSLANTGTNHDQDWPIHASHRLNVWNWFDQVTSYRVVDMGQHWLDNGLSPARRHAIT